VVIATNANGTAAPSIGASGGSGDRIILFPGGTDYPYAIGVNGGTLWNSAPSGTVFSWYNGGTVVMSLSSSTLTAPGLSGGCISDSTTSTSRTTAASSAAVKAVNDRVVTSNGTFVPTGISIISTLQKQNNGVVNTNSTTTAGNGYQIFPSGLIFQWVTVPLFNLAYVDQYLIPFPKAFPTACLSISPTAYMDIGYDVALVVYSYTLSSCEIRIGEWATDIQSGKINLFIVGY
jgi:hypothetical protein